MTRMPVPQAGQAGRLPGPASLSLGLQAIYKFETGQPGPDRHGTALNPLDPDSGQWPRVRVLRFIRVLHHVRPGPRASDRASETQARRAWTLSCRGWLGSSEELQVT
jgi:hypothetical protein